MVLKEIDLGKKGNPTLKEGSRGSIQAEQWCLENLESIPWYGEDVIRLFGDRTDSSGVVFMLPAALREFRPYPLPPLPQDAFVSVQNSEQIEGYFFSGIDKVSNQPHLLSKEQQERFDANRNTLVQLYQNNVARPLLDRLCLVAPEMLWAIEARFFNQVSGDDIAKIIGKPSSVTHEMIQTGLRLLGILDKGRRPTETRLDLWLRPVVIRFPEIAEIIVGLPENLQLPAWEIVRGNEILGDSGIAQRFGISASGLENLRYELFFGRLSFSTTAFIAEREKSALRQLERIPYSEQPFTKLAMQFLEAKTAGKNSGETGVDINDEHMIMLHLIENLAEEFPDLATQIIPGRSFYFSLPFWQEIKENYGQFIDKMKKDGRSITEYDKAFIDRFCKGETITKGDEARAHMLLGAPKPQVVNSKNRILLAEAFIQEGGLVTLVNDETREIVGLIQSGTSFLEITKKYPQMKFSKLRILQKQMVNYLLMVRHQSWLQRIKEGEFGDKIPIFDNQVLVEFSNNDRVSLAALRRKILTSNQGVIQGGGEMSVSLLQAVMFIYAVHARTLEAFNPRITEVEISQFSEALKVCEKYMAENYNLVPSLNELVKAFRWFLRKGKYRKT